MPVDQGAPALLVHGLEVSYFTGKLEAYLRAKGLPYRLQEMDTASFRRCARATGIAQMPQVELADGSWLTDTTQIIAYFERQLPAPAMLPADPATGFIAQLIEAFGDEWLWRPALYYRWAHASDARQLGERLAKTMLRDVPLPLVLRRWFITQRQKQVFLRNDGINARTAPQVEQLYIDVLDTLEAILSRTPYLLGRRPTVADFGLFGSMFRHFSSDPTPARIMRERAPGVLAWVTRLWQVQPQDFSAQPLPDAMPAGLEPLARMIAVTFLPYLAANGAAHQAGAASVVFDGLRARVNPYRVWRLARLQDAYKALPAPAKCAVAAWLGNAQSREILEDGRLTQIKPVLPVLPIRPGQAGKRPVDHQWHP